MMELIPNHKERALFDYVNAMIDTGKRRIAIPPEMMNGVRKEAVEELLRLCKLNGVEIL